MGMFDTIRSSFDLGEEFTEVELQTKDIEDGISGTLSHYWLDPHGYLYLIDYSGTSDLKIYDENDPEYNADRQWLNFKWISNGNKGKVTPWMITKYIEVYPARWDGRWEDCPRCRIHFKYGRIMDYEITTGR